MNARSGPPEPGWPSRGVQTILRTPLLTKLVLLDLAINVLVLAVMQLVPPEMSQQLTIASLGIVLVLNAALVAIALRPLQVLEDTAHRVARGDFEARTTMPWLADRNLVRIGATLDGLLDRVDADRTRLRSLASQLVTAEDTERARIARELHDGVAQQLAAVQMLGAALVADLPPGDTQDRVRAMHDVLADALQEVRALAHAMHPRVLDDLGLAAAIEHLARQARARTSAAVTVDLDVAHPVPDLAGAVLYRIAQEAVHNAIKHARPSQIAIRLEVDQTEARLTVTDDGRGFDRDAVEGQRPGMGMFVMEERASLADGELHLTSRPGRGTRIDATVPVSA